MRRRFFEVDWFKVPHWLYWMSFRPRRCAVCKRLFWGFWYCDICSKECHEADCEMIDAMIEAREYMNK